MPKVLLLGSGNRDKARELSVLLADSGWEVKGLRDFPEVPEPEEDQDTFEGNALLKARYYGAHFNLPCVSDDSGIEVDALDGAPGVYAARYAGEDCSYEDNNVKLLAALDGVEVEQRGARFVCCAAFVDVKGNEFTELGSIDGHIAPAICGTNGFGYDPVFIPEGHVNTFGELSPEVKRSISHRGQAFRKLSETLRKHATA